MGWYGWHEVGQGEARVACQAQHRWEARACPARRRRGSGPQVGGAAAQLRTGSAARQAVALLRRAWARTRHADGVGARGNAADRHGGSGCAFGALLQGDCMAGPGAGGAKSDVKRRGQQAAPAALAARRRRPCGGRREGPAVQAGEGLHAALFSARCKAASEVLQAGQEGPPGALLPAYHNNPSTAQFRVPRIWAAHEAP